MTKKLLVFIFLFALLNCNAKDKKGSSNLNKLKDEISPYLLQHADNPVEWYPWGEEAFEKARTENKPIFLSIGYSSCHWCHVMEHESFEDQDVADILNESFVSVKVDREERPDIDNIYMIACQMMSQNCGWPLNLFINHDLKPFFAGTYYPKEGRYGRMGFVDLLNRVKDQWANNREKIDESADAIGAAINSDQANSNGNFNEALIDEAYKAFSQNYDTENGGFGLRPKFPSPHNLRFLMRYYNSTGNEEALGMVTHTLLEMRKGGIYDQIGFGFHRYSTDNIWLLPHFEKMLYDQATLLKAYTEAYKITGNEIFKRTAYEIIEYVKRDMTGENGEFYSAEDADSEGIEGKFYVWESEEIKNILGTDAEKFIEIYNIYEKGNYREEAAGHGAGGNIPHTDFTRPEIAKILGVKESEIENEIEKMRVQLYNEREKRVHPFKDKKALTDWNAHFTTSLAYAARSFDDESILELALKNIDFIESSMHVDGKLYHSYLNEKAANKSNLDDYAYLVNAYLEMYNATLDVSFLNKSIIFTNQAIDKYWDTTNGGFYFSDADSTDLIARTKDYYDNAIPSGNSIMLNNLIKIGKITGESKYLDYSEKMLNSISELVQKAPTAFAELFSGALLAFKESFEVVIIGNDNLSKKMINELNKHYLPNMVLVYKENDESNSKISEIAEYSELMYMINGKSTVYVCKNFTCENPTNDIEKMLNYLNIKK
ncbi:thioredoxin domain-containing protein [Candidatus Kapabacteria bacterium]|nr:thioredoxin domain-containing protein [Candidatus Kapabacteria bacterium]